MATHVALLTRAAGVAVSMSLAGVVGCRDGAGTRMDDAGARVRAYDGFAEAWVTTADQQRLLAPLPVRIGTAANGRGGDASVTIVLDTTTTFQSMVGFGAALTDATVEVLQRIPVATARQRLLEDLFSTATGIGLSFVRFTIGASDFSPEHYTLDDMPRGARDTTLAQFSIAREQRAKLPLLREIRRLNPQVTVMATPWSAPAWMKTPASLYGGTLRPDAMSWYAAYLTRAIAAYAADSVPVALLSVQNEPQHAPPDYPGMLLTPTQRARLVGQELGPRLAALARATGTQTRIVEWDHNWDAPESPLAVLADTIARSYVHGVAWHCYAGDVRAQSVVHERHPKVATYFTECSGGAWATNWGDNLLWNTRTLLIGATRHWARGVLLWNLALDEQHGPHRGGCKDCRGVVTVERATGSVTRNEEYYALAHASRFVLPGAHRIASTGGAPLEHVAFRDSSAATVVLIANADTLSHATVITGGRAPVHLTIPARSVTTVRVSTTPFLPPSAALPPAALPPTR